MRTSKVKTSPVYYLISFFLAFLIIFNSGCDAYESPYPITSKGDTPLDTTLLGLWFELSEPGKKDSLNLPEQVMVVYEWNDYEFLTVLHNYEDFEMIQDEDSMYLYLMTLCIINAQYNAPYKIWNSMIDSTELINCQKLGQDTVFNVIQLSRNEDHLEIDYLSEGIGFVPKSSLDFKTLIEENQDTVFAHMKPYMKFYRAEDLKWSKINPVHISKVYQKEYEFPKGDSLSEDRLKKITQSFIYEFAETDIAELAIEANYSSYNPDSLLKELNNYHLEFLMEYERAGIQNEFLILEINERYYIKLIKSPDYLMDATNFLFYKRIKEK